MSGINAGPITLSRRLFSRETSGHIIDELIEERTRGLASHPLWPLVRPVLYRLLQYRAAVDMADRVAPLGGLDAFETISSILQMDVQTQLFERIPRTGACIVAPNHPTGIADGIAIYDALKTIRTDMAIFANRDALRAAPGFRDMIIPVEWRAGEKSHAKSRDTLAMAARAFRDNKMIVLFPSGRVAFWHEGELTERPWQPSILHLARKYEAPVIPVNIKARNSGLFYLFSRFSNELRDMTLFYETLNKRNMTYSMVAGLPISPEGLDGEPDEVIRRLQEHTLTAIRNNPDVKFT